VKVIPLGKLSKYHKQELSTCSGRRERERERERERKNVQLAGFPFLSLSLSLSLSLALVFKLGKERVSLEFS
jgi:hypothetical protein